MKTKNDVAWENLFSRYDILSKVQQNGIYRISAATINGEREARLMTKFDQRASLPEIFRDNHLSILPDSRGTYLIGDFDSYQNLTYDSTLNADEIAFPSEIETIDPTNLYSEAAGLLCAYNARILDRLVDEEVRFTVAGRMSTGVFDYQIKTGRGSEQNAVANAQCEIDGGFESASKMLIIEAKNFETDDFLIRQLYYPYRLWRGKTRKQIVPVFMTLSNDVFSFHVFRFRNEAVYNSLELVETRKFRVAPVEISLTDILAELAKASALQPTAPPRVPFPQANSFRRVVDLLGLLQANGYLTQDQVASNYVFTGRQAHYYPTAGIYLGLIKRDVDANRSVVYALTNEGDRIMKMPSRQKFLALANVILRNRVFARTLQLYIDNGDRPSETDVCAIMISENVPLNDTTVRRRAQTVLAWVDWILDLQHQ